jgi:peptidoglycan biosynthesis protein MviN/MurJ (putative lipid II flippase)
MGSATLISRLLGLVREQVFAFLFGAEFQISSATFLPKAQ